MSSGLMKLVAAVAFAAGTIGAASAGQLCGGGHSNEVSVPSTDGVADSSKPILDTSSSGGGG